MSGKTASAAIEGTEVTQMWTIQTPKEDKVQRNRWQKDTFYCHQPRHANVGFAECDSLAETNMRTRQNLPEGAEGFQRGK